MSIEPRPRPFSEWRNNPSDRDEDAAHAYGYHLVLHCRDEAMATLALDATAEVRAAVEKAVDTALHNLNDMLEGFWKLESGADHSIELALAVRVRDNQRNIVEERELSPCKLDLPIGYWKWAQFREFR